VLVSLSIEKRGSISINSGEPLFQIPFAVLLHQSVNVVGSYHTRFGPQIRNDTYLEYEAFAKKDCVGQLVDRETRFDLHKQRGAFVPDTFRRAVAAEEV
jgi:hypothetical protein